MADSLHKPFDNLNLSPQSQQPSQKEANMDLDSPMQLALPQTNTHGRSMYYGFEVTDEWLIAYAKAESERRGYYPDPPHNDYDQIYMCLPLLSSSTRIRKLTYKAVFEQGAPILPKRRQTFPLPKVTQIVAICSPRPNWFQKRPSQRQFDELKQIMGNEPQWWVLFD
ncbi:hypothetical protein BYT27DRAFT_7245710 [Phlegmacium glaucopus]|nr:hypothetical protein BYT27DRAFT_7245710 [Phlegmacium glaucopus]